MLTQNDHYGEKSPFFVGLSEAVFGDAVEAALEYHRRGFMVTSLHGKRPVLKNWQQRELSDQEIPHYFGDERNVGIVLGGLAGIVDVDLDSPMAVVAADLLLPDTMESGREKSPRSHRWYICNRAPASRKYTLPKSMADRLKLEPGEEALVELRSTGQRTMVAPSIHPVDGDRYLWHPGEIYKIDGQELAEFVLDVAIATLLAFNVPLGSRQHFIVHEAGHLIRLVGRDRAKTIVGAASAAVDDEEHDERMWTVRHTLRKLTGNRMNTDVAYDAELERLAPGVPDLISRWCRCDRRNYRREV